MGVEDAPQRLGVKRTAHRLAVVAARACERRRCRARGCGCGSVSGGWGAAARACERRRCRARGCGCGSVSGGWGAAARDCKRRRCRARGCGSGGWGACGGSAGAAGSVIRGAGAACSRSSVSRGGNDGCSRVSAQARERPVHVDANVAVAVGRGRDQRGVLLAREFWRGEQGPRRRPQRGGQRDAAPPFCAVGLARADECANELAPVARLHRSAQGIDVAGRGRGE